MNASNTQRTIKLVLSLLKNPKHFLPYLKTNIFIKKSPMDWPYPWWSFDAITEADKIFPGKRIFEYGSGGSTVRYASSAASITSVEDDSDWLTKVAIKTHDKRNITLLHRPFDFRKPTNFENSDYLLALDSSVYDVIIVDGQDWTFKQRISCFHHAEKFMKPGGLIIVDDYWRYEILTGSNIARSQKVFESTGPCRFGVTSTAFFYY